MNFTTALADRYRLYLSAFLLLLFLIPAVLVSAQEYKRIATIVTLDSFVVTATQQGFDATDFIELVQTDESFYKAFQNLRTISYKSSSALLVYNKAQQIETTYDATIHQLSDGDCRTMQFLTESIGPKFFKRKRKHRYYTTKMHQELFFTEGKICESNQPAPSTKGIARRIDQLKQLIFQPGNRIDIPFVADRTAIFEEDMIPLYDYNISSKKYQDAIDCYVFSARSKVAEDSKETIIKYLETYFDKSTFQVVARKYRIKYDGFGFDCDVEMDIKLTNLGGKYYPEYIHYNGNWTVPTQKREIVTFKLQFWDFE